MTTMIVAFRRHYGASPLHLIAFIVSVAVTGAALAGWLAEPAISIKYILIWFIGAILVHDMLLVPLYSALDRLALRVFGRRDAGTPSDAAAVRSPGWVYVRIPLMLSGLLLLVFGPEILRKGNATFLLASGHTQNTYLVRYLIVVAVMFILSGLAYARSSARASSRIP